MHGNATEGGNRIRVLVVDDSAVMRRLVTQALVSDPTIDVVATANNGEVALQRIQHYQPDLVTMDVEMPVMNGIDAVRAIRATGNRVPIIMCSTLTSLGAEATLDALTAGATDYVTKPTGEHTPEQSLQQLAGDIHPKIHALTGRPRPRSRAIPAMPVVLPTRPAKPRSGTVQAVVIGASTGGPEALSRVLTAMTHPLPVPLLIVQHMPPVFTTQLANRLARLTGADVIEASGGEALTPGRLYVAPGNKHLVVRRNTAGAVTAVNDDPPVHFCRPAVDMLFQSAADTYGGNLLGVVLTGMGTDGRDGALRIKNAGGAIIAQDEGTSVVWGMPGSVVTAGAADHVLPIDHIATRIEAIVLAGAR